LYMLYRLYQFIAFSPKVPHVAFYIET
jgi:hypothetical protein